MTVTYSDVTDYRHLNTYYVQGMGLGSRKWPGSHLCLLGVSSQQDKVIHPSIHSSDTNYVLLPDCPVSLAVTVPVNPQINVPWGPPSFPSSLPKTERYSIGVGSVENETPPRCLMFINDIFSPAWIPFLSDPSTCLDQKPQPKGKASWCVANLTAKGELGSGSWQPVTPLPCQVEDLVIYMWLCNLCGNRESLGKHIMVKGYFHHNG